MLCIGDAEHAGQFLAGWLTEYSLSIDNLFVFVIIMARFAVPRKYQQEVLMVGIIIALVFRGIFILLGAQLIENFSWIFYIFGAFLLYTAFNQAFGNHDDDEDEREPASSGSCASASRSSNDFDGAKLRTVDRRQADASRRCSSCSSRSAPPTCCSPSTRSRPSSASRRARSSCSPPTSSR